MGSFCKLSWDQPIRRVLRRLSEPAAQTGQVKIGQNHFSDNATTRELRPSQCARCSWFWASVPLEGGSTAPSGDAKTNAAFAA